MILYINKQELRKIIYWSNKKFSDQPTIRQNGDKTFWITYTYCWKLVPLRNMSCKILIKMCTIDVRLMDIINSWDLIESWMCWCIGMLFLWLDNAPGWFCRWMLCKHSANIVFITRILGLYKDNISLSICTYNLKPVCHLDMSQVTGVYQLYCIIRIFRTREVAVNTVNTVNMIMLGWTI